MGEWVRYKLDQRTDHILVDEAQDTNEAQWDIVRALVEEYFSGSPEAEQRVRTLFMVGDFKQAIYGFQGTDPREFEKMRAKGTAAFASSCAPTRNRRSSSATCRSTPAIRSAQAMLDAVDAVIRDLGFRAMGLPEFPPSHVAHHSGRPGIVELWKPFALEDFEEGEEGEEGWLDADARGYADKLAKQVRAWIDEAPVLDSTKRPLTAGDILILVRSRGELASLIVARLFCRGRSGRGHRPAVPVQAVRGARPARRGDLRRAAARRPQPRQPAGFAADRLGPAAAVRSRPRARKGALWRALARARRGARGFRARTRRSASCWRWPITRLRRASSRRSSPVRSTAAASFTAASALAARDPIDELMTAALEFETQRSAVARALPRLVRARRCRDQARPVRSARMRCG